MKIVADENIALARELFGAFGEVVTVPGRGMTPDQVADADVLLVRSVTRVDSRLLAHSRVGFVGTATIGTDHLDLPWLASRGIAWGSAPGCNAAAVADYVIAALSAADPHWLAKSVTIVGCGNVGGGLYRRLAALGVACLCVDPFVEDASGLPLVSFGEALDADILCLHTPLTRDGPHPTWHLVDEAVLARLRPGALVVNAGRGEVVDNRALLAALASGRVRAILDVWEGEPAINTALLEHVAIGTPHIAGYSLEGRVRGSLMVYDALRRWSGEGAPLDLDALHPLLPAGENVRCPLAHDANPGFCDAVLAAYDPRRDTASLGAAVAGLSPDAVGAAFDRLRKHYPWRREFSHFVLPGGLDAQLRRRLLAAGFGDGGSPC